MSARVWILPTRPDPEAEMIERILTDARETVATSWDDAAVDAALHAADGTVYAIEREDWPSWGMDAVRIDHHAAGDPGYGRPPAEFLAASSIGQVLAALVIAGALPRYQLGAAEFPAQGPVGSFRFGAVQPSPDGEDCAPIVGLPPQWCIRCLDPQGELLRGMACSPTAPLYPVYTPYVYAAAADHCLAAAYAGECPGVDPDALMRWRVETRAKFQGRAVEDLLADVERAIARLKSAKVLALWEAPDERDRGRSGDMVTARDMRGQHTPELPEAAAREGVCFVADGLPGPDGRVKVVCQSGRPGQIRAFLDEWAPAQGLVDLYGDPARGFAGGYRP